MCYFGKFDQQLLDPSENGLWGFLSVVERIWDFPTAAELGWFGLISFWIAALSRHHTSRFVASCSRTKKFVASFFYFILTTRSPVGFVFSMLSNIAKIWKLRSPKLCKTIKLTRNGLSCATASFLPSTMIPSPSVTRTFPSSSTSPIVRNYEYPSCSISHDPGTA